MNWCHAVIVSRKEGPPKLPSSLDELPSLLTVDELAVLLRTSSKSVYAMVERGQLPGVTRVGRRLLFRRDDLLRWLDESRVSSPKERRP